MYKVFKRLIDFLVAVISLVILSPVLIIIAVIIKLDSKGPVFFTQTRIGYKGEPFLIFKFRTMVNRVASQINQYEEGIVKKENDSRVTKVGAFLRVTSLDELPQLINVLLGSMSLIGPRPILPEQKLVVPSFYRERFAVQPGITGLAQTKGRRSLSWEQQLIFDCEYARKISFLLDINILYRTFIVVLLRKDIFGAEGKNWRLYIDEWKDK